MKINLIQISKQEENEIIYNYYKKITKKYKLSKENKIELALYAIKLVKKFASHIIKGIVDDYIKYVEKWLENHNSINKLQHIDLISIFNNIVNHTDDRYILFCLQYIINSINSAGFAYDVIQCATCIDHSIIIKINLFLQFLLTKPKFLRLPMHNGTKYQVDLLEVIKNKDLNFYQIQKIIDILQEDYDIENLSEYFNLDYNDQCSVYNNKTELELFVLFINKQLTDEN